MDDSHIPQGSNNLNLSISNNNNIINDYDEIKYDEEIPINQYNKLKNFGKKLYEINNNGINILCPHCNFQLKEFKSRESRKKFIKKKGIDFNEFICDVCLNQIQSNSMHFSCQKKCNYDLCTYCFVNYKTIKQSQH